VTMTSQPTQLRPYRHSSPFSPRPRAADTSIGSVGAGHTPIFTGRLSHGTQFSRLESWQRRAQPEAGPVRRFWNFRGRRSTFTDHSPACSFFSRLSFTCGSPWSPSLSSAGACTALPARDRP
jgi:hypothetical protein